MKGFREFVLLSEAPGDLAGGAPPLPGAPPEGGPPLPPGGGMPPPGMPPMGGGGAMGGGMPPPGMPPMGGGMGGAPSQQPLKLKTYDVWSVLERLLAGKKIDDDKTGGKPKPAAPMPGMDPMGGAPPMGGMGGPPMGAPPMGAPPMGGPPPM